jgi:hypothetical protein
VIDVKPATTEIGGVTYSLHPARIDYTHLGYEDHGIFTAVLYLDFGGSAQGAGTYILDSPEDADSGKYTRVGTAYGHDWIIQAMRVVGVDKWESMQGKRVYALREQPYGMIKGLININNHSNYFLFDVHAREFKIKWPEGR